MPRKINKAAPNGKSALPQISAQLLEGNSSANTVLAET
jgi:hypothetical protein